MKKVLVVVLCLFALSLVCAAQSIDTLNLFPTYTRDSWVAAHPGQALPAFNTAKAPKTWEDPAAKDAPEDFVIYTVLATDGKDIPVALKGPDGKPYTKRMVVMKADAGTVNIPPATLPAGTKLLPAVPMPLKPVPTGLILDWSTSFASGGYWNVVVRDPNNKKAVPAIAFTSYHEGLLERIAAALGVQ